MKLKEIICNVNEHFPKEIKASSKSIKQLADELPKKLLSGGYDDWHFSSGHKMAYGIRYLAYSGFIPYDEIQNMKNAFANMCQELWGAKGWMDIHLVSSTLIEQKDENGDIQVNTITQYVYNWGIIINE